MIWGGVGAREVLPGRWEGMWDGKKARNGMKSGCSFLPGSAGTLNYKARGQTSAFCVTLRISHFSFQFGGQLFKLPP